MTTYTPLNDRVLIQKVEADNPTIVMPETTNHPEDRYYAVAVATNITSITPGDELLLLPNTAVQIVGNAADLLGLVHVSAIAAVIHRTKPAFNTIES